jgi:predicted phage terminase large subunit-like protein
LAKHPGAQIIGASHTASLAEDFSGEVQRIIRDNQETLGYALENDGRSLWSTTNRGKFMGSGVGMGIAGFRADLAIIDDPIRSRADAESDTLRERVWQWYNSDLATRLRPEGCVVLIMTRYHEDDLAGRLLERQPGRWKVISLPAFADSPDDPLGRAEGEPLWDDDGYGYGRELKAKREEYEAAGLSRDYWSLYQQQPRPPEGSLFKTTNVSVLDILPSQPLQVVRAWDIAATKAVGNKDPDWTASVKLARMQDNKLLVLDVQRLRGTPDEVERAIVTTARADGTGVKVLYPQDPGSAGIFAAEYMGRALMGFSFEAARESGDKTTRASPAASQCNIGNLAIMRGHWNPAFIDELSSFPSGRHDDMVDALSRAFSYVMPDVIGMWIRLAGGY